MIGPPPVQQKEGLRILTLDGGNWRGTSQLEILNQIMRSLTLKKVGQDVFDAQCEILHPANHFDLIVGSGCGAIVAILLTRFKLSFEQALDEYLAFLRAVFKTRTRGTPSDIAMLEKALKNLCQRQLGDSEALLYDPLLYDPRICPVAVCAIPVMSIYEPNFFRSYRAPRFGGMADIPEAKVWEVFRAVLADLDLFPAIEIGPEHQKLQYMNTDLGGNNPIHYAVREAYALWGAEEPVQVVISIGAGQSGPVLYKNDVDLSTVLKKLAKDAESAHQSMLAQLIQPPRAPVYFRFNVYFGHEWEQKNEWNDHGEVIRHTRAYMATAKVAQQQAEAVEALRGGIAICRVKRLIGRRLSPEMETSQVRPDGSGNID